MAVCKNAEIFIGKVKILLVTEATITRTGKPSSTLTLDGYHRKPGCESENKVDMGRIKESKPNYELDIARAVELSETGGITIGIKSGTKRFTCPDSFFSEDKLTIKAGEDDNQSLGFICGPITEEHYINNAWVKVKKV